MSEPPAVAPISRKLMGPQMIFGTEVVSQKADHAYMPGRPTSEINAITRRTRRGRPPIQDSQCFGEACCISRCPPVLMISCINHSTDTTFCQCDWSVSWSTPTWRGRDSPSSADDSVFDVRHRWRGDHLDRLQDGIAHILKQALAGAKDDRHDVEIELVEHSGPKVLPHRACTASDRDVPTTGCRPGLLQCWIDPRDERECGATLHREGPARVVREHEDRRVERRFVAPP